ncbi:hypothetical protein [Desulfoluna butyratoxydans]|uniref:Uncharacterized protein n=1 Tax=Desulfoluna butyratoxydans TaxID=231438 RepID=A0A4U8YLQ8_9BACT|nr:hypothetical protein [Desulfoluna butyratoxydans]VFQ44661.1 hypothetical protein MSL71_23100 [Desulfoluna butyratoxydans]
MDVIKKIGSRKILTQRPASGAPAPRRGRTEERLAKAFVSKRQVPVALWSAPHNLDANLVHMAFPFDALPRFTYSKKVPRDTNGKATPIHLAFSLAGTPYDLTILPATIREKGNTRSYLPGLKEELIEAVLRKWFSQGAGVTADNAAGIFFTLYDLRRELMRSNHTYSFDQLKLGLNILCGAHMTVKTKDHAIAGGGLLTSVLWDIDKATGPESRRRCLCVFHPEVFRMISFTSPAGVDYGTFMACRSGFSRWLLRWLCLMPDTRDQAMILRLSDLLSLGILKNRRFRDNVASVRQGLDELAAMEIIRTDYEMEKVLDGRRIVDAEIRIEAESRLSHIRHVFETERRKLGYIRLINHTGGFKGEVFPETSFQFRPFFSDPKIRELVEENIKLKQALKEKI